MIGYPRRKAYSVVKALQYLQSVFDYSEANETVEQSRAG